MGDLDLVVAIVNWNVRDLLVGCLASVRRAINAAGLCSEIWVVDNASQDGSVAALREQFEDVHLVDSPVNLWFGGGQNLALRAVGFSGVPLPAPAEVTPEHVVVGDARWARRREAPPRYVLVLNPDTLLREDALAEMVRLLERDPAVGVCGPRLVYGDGRFQHSAYRFPSLMQLLLDFWPLNWRLTESRLNGRYPRRLYEGEKAFAIDHPLGAAMLFRGEVIDQTGGFDLEYRMYVEEIDWCMRVRRAGWKICCVPTAEVVHYEGQSTRQVKPAMIVALWRSRYRFFARYYAPLTCWMARRIIRAGMRAESQRVRARLAGHALDEHEGRALLAAYRQVAAM
jgi:N-acetylglucosaminyl-diphospho-decaprenol L-rhamnosyltransferase